MKQLKQFEDFLKLVQEKNSDEFLELKDIIERFTRLQKSNKDLARDHADAEKEIDF